MKRARAILLCGGGPLVWSAFALMARAAEPATWQWEFAGGVDGTVHTYALAVADTTETISEFMVQAALEGRSVAAPAGAGTCVPAPRPAPS